MSAAHVDGPYQGYREALRRHVCSICLDGDDDNRCSLRGTPCPMEEHIAALVEGVLEALERHDTRHAALLERVVCARCRHAGSAATCERRENGRCALSAYLPLVVETIRRGPSAA